MSAKTQKTWRELCYELHNEQDPDQLMDGVHELNGALEQRIMEMMPLDPENQSLRLK